MIKVVEIENDIEVFESTINGFMNDGWRIISSNCGIMANYGTGEYDTIYQAIVKKT